MPWKCPQDANDVPDEVNKCPLCGFVRFPSGIVIKSDTTGKELQIRLGATFGRANLKILADPEIQYVSPEQFKIEKRQEQGGWAIVNLTWATHPLFLTGAPIDPTGELLQDGDRLSIKDKYVRMTIRMLMT